jgi:hypothetical protein
LEQTSGREIRIVGLHAAYGEPFGYFVNWLKDWKRLYNISFGKHVLPHDGASKSPQTGKSAQEYLQELVNEHIGGTVEVAKRPNIKSDGIEAIRQIIPKCLFDKKACSGGIDALTQYHKEWDPKKEVYRHVHDWSSHYVDGFQTLALSHQFKTSGVVWKPNRKKHRPKGLFSRSRL